MTPAEWEAIMMQAAADAKLLHYEWTMIDGVVTSAAIDGRRVFPKRNKRR